MRSAFTFEGQLFVYTKLSIFLSFCCGEVEPLRNLQSWSLSSSRPKVLVPASSESSQAPDSAIMTHMVWDVSGSPGFRGQSLAWRRVSVCSHHLRLCHHPRHNQWRHLEQYHFTWRLHNFQEKDIKTKSYSHGSSCIYLIPPRIRSWTTMFWIVPDLTIYTDHTCTPHTCCLSLFH